MCDHCASTDGARRAQNCALYTSVCFVVSVPLFAMCSRLFMSICRSQMFVNMRCRIHSLYRKSSRAPIVVAIAPRPSLSVNDHAHGFEFFHACLVPNTCTHNDRSLHETNYRTQQGTIRRLRVTSAHNPSLLPHVALLVAAVIACAMAHFHIGSRKQQAYCATECS